MKESDSEILARCAGPESYAGGGNIAGVATAGVHIGPVIELRNQAISRADTVKPVEGHIPEDAIGKPSVNAAESKTRCMCGNSRRENRETPSACRRKSSAAVQELHRR